MIHFCLIFQKLTKIRFLFSFSFLLLYIKVTKRTPMHHSVDHRTQPTPRSSKISNALKKNFIDTILKQGITVKEAAKKFKINYSTAKVIFRLYKVEQRHRMREERNMSNYGEEFMKQSDEQEQLISGEEKRRCGYQSLYQNENREQSESTDSLRRNQIVVISTVAWDFFKHDLPRNF